jgi:hypothetical protein
MSIFTEHDLNEALVALGELTEARGQSFELVVVGGGGMLLQGLLGRTTQDLDVVARIEQGAYVTAEPLPGELREAVAEVAELYGLGDKWLNAGPTDLLRFGLPDGFDQRTETRRYKGLTLHLAGRQDQIAFKLYAAVDQGPLSKHFRDLQDLNPTRAELLFGARWAVTHDTSPDFADQLAQALEALGIEDADLS